MKPEEVPIIIDLDNMIYFDEFEGAKEKFNNVDELFKILQKYSCSRGHPEPVIHTSTVIIIKNKDGVMVRIKGDFYDGIPISKILNLINCIWSE